jgi:predicted phosphate transport protein (TIGR00153 family)
MSHASTACDKFVTVRLIGLPMRKSTRRSDGSVNTAETCLKQTEGVFRFRLIPREEKFFDDFVQLADRIVSAATLLERMLSSEPPAWETALQIKQIEQECDSLTHQIIQRLNRTFVTPIDREDIHQLATSLDDVMDAIDAAANVLRRYQIASLRYGARELASLVWQSTMQVRVALEALEKRKDVHERAVEINRLENAADSVHDEALRRLFEEEKNALTVMKWKEMLDQLEEATDRCEDVANVLEGVVVKHA